MASSPDTAAQAALLSAAFSASNNAGSLAKNIDKQAEPITSADKESLSPVKSDSSHENNKEEATTTATEESEAEMRDIKMETDDSKDQIDVSREDAELRGIDWRPLRSRSFLTDAQVGILSTQFKRNPFPSKYELSALAEQIGVNKRVVQVGGQIKLCRN